MNITEREPLLKLEINKNKIYKRIGNIALGQIIKDIKSKIQQHSTAKAITERCGMKKKNRNRTSHEQQPENVKFRKKLKLLEVNYLQG